MPMASGWIPWVGAKHQESWSWWFHNAERRSSQKEGRLPCFLTKRFIRDPRAFLAPICAGDLNAFLREFFRELLTCPTGILKVFSVMNTFNPRDYIVTKEGFRGYVVKKIEHGCSNMYEVRLAGGLTIRSGQDLQLDELANQEDWPVLHQPLRSIL